MYWFRTDSPLSILIWLTVAVFWGTGGWLAVASTFKLKMGENLFLGFGIGLSGYLSFANVLGHWFPPDVTFLGAGGVVFLSGLGFWALQHRKNPLRFVESFDIRSALPLFVAMAGLTWVFLRISEGVGMFDEFTHLPLISTLAAGDIPPRFFINSEIGFAYHYGFQLLGASLMRLGGLFPWSAFDVSKALLWGYAVVLAWLVGERFGRKPWGGWLAALAVVFASGTRYLLLLAPRSFLFRADPLLTFQGNEAEFVFSKWMIRIWEAEGSPPIGIPYAFLSGITEPLAIAHAGLHILHVIILLMLWLLAGRISARGPAIGLFTMLFSLWALTWESSYVLVVGGGVLAALLLFVQEYRMAQSQNSTFAPKARISTLPPAVLALLLSIPIALVQGGLLTEIARGIFLPGTETATAPAASGLSLRWPPAILSKHLGPLSLFSPITLLIAICELGPVLFFLPWITRWAWQKFRAEGWVWGTLLFSAWAGFLIPVVINHRVSSDLSRVAAHGMLIFILFFILRISENSWPAWVQTAAIASLGLMMVGGGVLFASALTAANRPMLAAKFDELDALVTKEVWDTLPAEAKIFDPNGWPGTAITGRLTHAVEGDYFTGIRPYPAWQALVHNPTLLGLLAENYSFVYVNEKWWNSLSAQSRAELEAACVVTRAAHQNAEGDRFRRMLDLSGCQ
ncbi:MAG: hypothetical protein Fur0022_45980 [Anaerolineales bacterium]